MVFEPVTQYFCEVGSRDKTISWKFTNQAEGKETLPQNEMGVETRLL